MNRITRNISRCAPIAPIVDKSEAISPVATPIIEGHINRQKGRFFHSVIFSPPFTGRTDHHFRTAHPRKFLPRNRPFSCLHQQRPPRACNLPMESSEREAPLPNMLLLLVGRDLSPQKVVDLSPRRWSIYRRSPVKCRCNARIWCNQIR